MRDVIILFTTLVYLASAEGAPAQFDISQSTLRLFAEDQIKSGEITVFAPVIRERDDSISILFVGPQGTTDPPSNGSLIDWLIWQQFRISFLRQHLRQSEQAGTVGDLGLLINLDELDAVEKRWIERACSIHQAYMPSMRLLSVPSSKWEFELARTPKEEIEDLGRITELQKITGGINELLENGIVRLAQSRKKALLSKQPYNRHVEIAVMSAPEGAKVKYMSSGQKSLQEFMKSKSLGKADPISIPVMVIERHATRIVPIRLIGDSVYYFHASWDVGPHTGAVNEVKVLIPGNHSSLRLTIPTAGPPELSIEET